MMLVLGYALHHVQIYNGFHGNDLTTAVLFILWAINLAGAGWLVLRSKNDATVRLTLGTIGLLYVGYTAYMIIWIGCCAD